MVAVMEIIRRINLNALHTLVIVARYGNLTRAAEEQLLTPSAVSQRVSRIESQLRFRIFHRGPNGLSLTTDGAKFMEKIGDALSVIEDAATEFGAAKDESLRIAVTPTFARRWLFPRMPDFRARFPNIELHFVVEAERGACEQNEFDARIFYVDAKSSIDRFVTLINTDLVPVCSPEFFESLSLRSSGRKLNPELLSNMAILQSRTCIADWRLWLSSFDAVHVLDRAPTILFDNCMLTFDAAEAGLGFAMASQVYVQDALNRGELVAPFPPSQSQPGRWCLSTPASGVVQSAYERFLGWILEEAGPTQKSVRDSRDTAVIATDGHAPGP